MIDIDDLIARAERMLAENQWTSGWGVEGLAEELCEALESVRAERDEWKRSDASMCDYAARVRERALRAEAERDAALARIAELEVDRDEWKRLFSECHPVHLDGVERARRAEARIAEAAKLHRRDSPGLGGEWCQSDGLKWPCPTAVALGLNEGENDE